MKTLLFDMLNKEMFTLNYQFFFKAQKIVNDEITYSVKEFNKFKDAIKQDKQLRINVMPELNVFSNLSFKIILKCFYNFVFYLVIQFVIYLFGYLIIYLIKPNT